MKVKLTRISGIVATALLMGCTSHQVTVDPIEVKPIHVTMDINLKIQRDLEEFFDFREEIKSDVEEKKTGAG